MTHPLSEELRKLTSTKLLRALHSDALRRAAGELDSQAQQIADLRAALNHVHDCLETDGGQCSGWKQAETERDEWKSRARVAIESYGLVRKDLESMNTTRCEMFDQLELAEAQAARYREAITEIRNGVAGNSWVQRCCNKALREPQSDQTKSEEKTDE